MAAKLFHKLSAKHHRKEARFSHKESESPSNPLELPAHLQKYSKRRSDHLGTWTWTAGEQRATVDNSTSNAVNCGTRSIISYEQILEIELKDDYSLPADAEQDTATALYCEPVNSLKVPSEPDITTCSESLLLETSPGPPVSPAGREDTPCSDTDSIKRSTTGLRLTPSPPEELPISFQPVLDDQKGIIAKGQCIGASTVTVDGSERTANNCTALTVEGLATVQSHCSMSSGSRTDVSSEESCHDYQNAYPPNQRRGSGLALSGGEVKDLNSGHDTPANGFGNSNTEGGGEYESPWDLRDTETEIYELVKQVKDKEKNSLVKQINVNDIPRKRVKDGEKQSHANVTLELSPSPAPVLAIPASVPAHLQCVVLANADRNTREGTGRKKQNTQPSPLNSTQNQDSKILLRQPSQTSETEKHRKKMHRTTPVRLHSLGALEDLSVGDSSPKGNQTEAAEKGRGGKQPSLSTVLVEGEWRESKQPVVVPSVVLSSDPSSPAQIVSHGNHYKLDNNIAAAFNDTYGDQEDGEILAKLRYQADKLKTPLAQPRANSNSRSQSVDDEAVYQNFRDAETNQLSDANGIYEDPWNSEQLQQELIDKLRTGLNPEKSTVSKQSKDALAAAPIPAQHTLPTVSSLISITSPCDSMQPSRNKEAGLQRSSRPADMPVDASKSRPKQVATTTPKMGGSAPMDKQSSRVISDNKGVKSVIAAPPVPRQGPGQAHASVPVLIRTSPVVLPPGSDPQGRRSQRKNYITETTYLTTRNHTYHFSGSNSEPTSPHEVPECQHRLGLAVDKTKPLDKQKWYHIGIQRGQAEELLQNQPDGSFLVRDCGSSARDFTLSLKNASGFIHIKIVQQSMGEFILGQFSHPFPSIMDMVEYYSRHKVNIKGAEHTYLEIPISRKQ